MGTVSGDRQIIAALRKLSKGPGAREIDTAATRAMNPMRDDARKRLAAHRNYASKYPAYFPKQRGPFGKHIDKGIVVRKDGKQSVGRRSYKLGGIGRAKSLLHLLEFGTAPHFQPSLLGGWMHPGSTPRPSMVPAYEHGKNGVIDSMSDDILDWAEREARGAGMRFSRTR